MIREFFSLLALVAGVYVGLKAGRIGVAVLSPQLASPSVAAMVAFVAAFIVAALILLFIGSLLARAAHAVHLGWADRIVGAAFGFAKGVLIVMIAVLLIAAFQPPESSWIRDSRVAGWVQELTRRACDRLPPDARDEIRRRMERTRPAPAGVNAFLPDGAAAPGGVRRDQGGPGRPA
jgi:membrane protein required for colicin V production